MSLTCLIRLLPLAHPVGLPAYIARIPAASLTQSPDWRDERYLVHMKRGRPSLACVEAFVTCCAAATEGGVPLVRQTRRASTTKALGDFPLKNQGLSPMVNIWPRG